MAEDHRALVAERLRQSVHPLTSLAKFLQQNNYGLNGPSHALILGLPRSTTAFADGLEIVV